MKTMSMLVFCRAAMFASAITRSSLQPCMPASRHMKHECVSRGYDFKGAAEARDDWMKAREAVEARERAEELAANADDDSILGLALDADAPVVDEIKVTELPTKE